DAGRDATLVVTKRAGAMATVAVARLVPRGRLTLVGLGPGAADLRTPRATEALRRAQTVVGLDQYVDQIEHLLRPGTTVLRSGLGEEEARARTAVELARAGHPGRRGTRRDPARTTDPAHHARRARSVHCGHALARRRRLQPQHCRRRPPRHPPGVPVAAVTF